MKPELNLVQGKSAADSQLGKEENWNARLEELFPFRFNTIGVTDGTVRHRLQLESDQPTRTAF